MPTTFSFQTSESNVAPNLRYSTSVRQFTTTVSSHDEGEAVYQQALEALQKVEELQQAREAKKSQELHRAIEKAEAKEKLHKDNPKAKNLKGVTVVKTVVKQTRKDKKNKDSIEDEETHWKDRAYELLKIAGLEHGHPEALVLLGNGSLQQAKVLWMDHAKVEAAKESVDLALDYYRKAGDKKSAAGWFNVGQLLWTGYPVQDDTGTADTTTEVVILKPDVGASMQAFHKAIELGDPDAMYFVGVLMLGNEDPSATIESLRDGLNLMTKSADLGHGPARYYRALFHLNGHEALGIQPCSPDEFVAFLNAATEAGNADALFLRALSYHDGEHGYPKDVELALKDFLASAEAGSADAAVSAGAMLYEGRPGLPRDPKRAFELYQLAGEMGSLDGWRNVAACYAEGVGVPKSLPTAKYILKTMLHGNDGRDTDGGGT